MNIFGIIFVAVFISACLLCFALSIRDKQIAELKRTVKGLEDWTCNVANTYNEHLIEFHNQGETNETDI